VNLIIIRSGRILDNANVNLTSNDCIILFLAVL